MLIKNLKSENSPLKRFENDQTRKTKDASINYVMRWVKLPNFTLNEKFLSKSGKVSMADFEKIMTPFWRSLCNAMLDFNLKESDLKDIILELNIAGYDSKLFPLKFLREVFKSVEKEQQNITHRKDLGMD